ncbi:hypothetical protein [uncultured Aquimarina sp.]|uniref:hypothetical protein n=1 Tax=uncultured Aquimarina sp. TaxID=575652 RepID=UPI00263A3040|nr:hypothetical protein [uncultured Aquimarina sp.]
MSAISGMNISMKNNNRRVKREAFSHITGESDTESKGIKVEPVSEEVLIKIRQKLRKQRQGLFRRRLIGFGVLIGFIVAMIVYSTF